MADDFEPTKTARAATYTWTGNRTRERYYPDSDNCVKIPYIECTSANEAAVNALLDQIEALAETYDSKIWTASKDAGLFPGMSVWIEARTNVTAAEVGAAEPVWVTIAACDSMLNCDRYQDSINLVLAEDNYVIGDGSLQWDKLGGIHNRTGLSHSALPGSPIDASDGEHVSVTFKVPTGTSFTSWTGAVLEIGTDWDNCVRYTWDTTDFVAGSWVTLTKEIDDVAATVGGGMDEEAIYFVRFYLDTLADMSTAIEGILLDNVRIV